MKILISAFIGMQGRSNKRMNNICERTLYNAEPCTEGIITKYLIFIKPSAKHSPLNSVCNHWLRPLVYLALCGMQALGDAKSLSSGSSQSRLWRKRQTYHQITWSLSGPEAKAVEAQRRSLLPRNWRLNRRNEEITGSQDSGLCKRP